MIYLYPIILFYIFVCVLRKFDPELLFDGGANRCAVNKLPDSFLLAAAPEDNQKRIILKKNDISAEEDDDDDEEEDDISNSEILDKLSIMFNILNSNIQSVCNDIENIKSSVAKLELQVNHLSSKAKTNYFSADTVPFEQGLPGAEKGGPPSVENRAAPKSVAEMVNKVYDLRIAADYKQFYDYDRVKNSLVISNKVNPAREAEYIAELFAEGERIYINRISFFNSSDVSDILFDFKVTGLIKGNVRFTPCFIYRNGKIDKGKIG